MTLTSGLRTYGESARGRDHVTLGKPCQDYSVNTLLDDHTALLIAADGVGSAAHAEEGSSTAAETVRDFLTSAPRPITPEVINQAYKAAYRAVEAHCAANTGRMEDYDTTLTVAVFDSTDGSITYGHSGDGGILALRRDGIVREITRPQKGPDGTSVLPLRAVNAWEFGRAPGEYVSVVAVTDGVRDILVPSILSLTGEHVYVRLFSWIADIRNFDLEHLEDGFAARLRNLEGDRWSRFTNDDFTLTVAMDTSVTAQERAESYYAEPDWKGLEERWRRSAYPSMYAGKSEPTVTSEEFRRLEERGEDIEEVDSIVTLADCLRFGWFSPVDLGRSCRLYIIASDLGSEKAREIITRVPFTRMVSKIRITMSQSGRR